VFLKNSYSMMLSLCFLALTVSQALAGMPGFEEDPESSPPMSTELFSDMKLTPKQNLAVMLGRDVGTGSNTFAGSDKVTLRWPNARVPFTIDCSLENMPSALRAIRLAMNQWEAKTCLRFVPRTNEKDYLEFFRNTHCWGHVGRIGGKSQISVGHGCDYEHVMVHEIGHAVGFWHEQNRMDRDNYVTVHWENIEEWVKSAFDKVKDSDDYGVPYDYASIMHYPWHAFSKNGKDTMTPKKPVTKQPYIELSDKDALQTNRMYQCSAMMPQASTSSCIDRDPPSSCNAWAANNGCRTSSYVLKNCAKTCNSPVCDTNAICKDERAQCKDWADWGHCTRNPTVMWLCVKSCAPRCQGVATTPQPQPPTQPPVKSTLPPVTGGPLPTTKTGGVKLGTGLLCLDKHPDCAKWAGWGECTRNPGYMLKNCKLSCNQTDCDRGIQKPPGTCNEPLGMAWDGNSWKIPDSAIRADSVLRPGSSWAASGHNARLYLHDDHTNKRIAAWCVASWDDFRKNPFIQVDLGRRRSIQYIATQGRDKYFERVSQYKISYSNDGTNFQPYMENGQEKLFDGNCDHFTPILNKFENRITARYVRLYPTKANYPCIRMEFYGC